MRTPTIVPAVIVLLAALVSPVAAQSNSRDFGIRLFARPIGSPSTPFQIVGSVGGPGFPYHGPVQPPGIPFAPVTVSATQALDPANEYLIRFSIWFGSVPVWSANVSLGQRLDLLMTAQFGQAAGVVLGASSHDHEVLAGEPASGFGSYLHLASSSGMPWNDAAAGTHDGAMVQSTYSIAYVASPSVGFLQCAATGETGATQAVPPPYPMPIEAFVSVESTVVFTVTQAMNLDLSVAATGEVRGESQFYPVLPIVPTVFTGGSGWWYDPPLALGYDFQQSGTSLFTDILTLPLGIDGDGLFEVQVGNQSLGQFAGGSRVDFQQLLGGNGVAAFRIVGIDPAVDAMDSAVFPVQLAFDTPTADFTMTPVLWRKVGSSCSDPAVCVQCPALALEPVGAALEGNLNFGLGIASGPGNGLAGFFVGLGTASASPVPLFCGSIVLPLQTAFFDVGFAVLSGTGSCDGAGAVSLPLTPLPPLVGLFLTAQAVTLCAGGGLGLTPGLEFAIGD